MGRGNFCDYRASYGLKYIKNLNINMKNNF